MKSHKQHLNEQLKDPAFRKGYSEEKQLIGLAVKISMERERLGISQADLAKKASITRQQLSKVEDGANCNVKTLVKVCTALGLRLDLAMDRSKSALTR